MENAPDEEPTEFLEPVEEIVENVEQHVEHEEVLEEIVHEDEMMYDADGRLIQYQNVVMYEDGSEVIEEYVEVEDLGNGEYAYVMTDEHGNRRLLKPEEVESVKKEMPLLVEEEMIDHKPLDPDGAGPSSSAVYANKSRGRFPGKANDKSSRASMRDLLGKGGAGMVYMDRDYYHESPAKRLTDMAKVDVEKYVPTVTVNRRPLPDNADFVKPKQHRSRKNPPWQDDEGATSSATRVRSPSPHTKSPLFPQEEDDMLVRFKCNECEEGFPIMDRLCGHMVKNHDCHTNVREVEFFNDRDFENFLFKIERQSLGKEADPHKTVSRKSRPGSSQVFVCNYMSKNRKKYPEFIEVGMAALAERPMEVCTAFVQKTHSYECIRVKYCDSHVHYDGNVGFRVPLSVKRRLYEMAFKRLPIPCMQVLLAHECESLLQNPSRFEEKLKNLSHVEIVEILGLIGTKLVKTHEGLEPIKGKKIPVKFESVTSDEGQETLVVVRANSPKPIADETELTNSHALAFSVDGEEVPMMAREEEVLEEDEEVTPPDGEGGILDENLLYDPQNKRDPRFDELTEVELGILEAYERDISVHLTEEQKKDRIRSKAKFSLAKVNGLYSALDAATHGLAPNEMHIETINQLRDMASYVVELVCTLDAEIKATFNPALAVEDIRRDMIAGIAMQERVYHPERRRRSGNSMNSSPVKPYQPRHNIPRSHDDYAERIFSKVKALQPPHRSVGINMSGTFNLTADERLKVLRQHQQREELPEEQKPSTSSLPPLADDFKAIPWSKPPRKRAADPAAPPRKRGRPNKKVEVAAVEAAVEGSVEGSAEQPGEQVVVEGSGEVESSGALEISKAPEASKPVKTAKEAVSKNKKTTTTDPSEQTIATTVEEPAPKEIPVKEEVPTSSEIQKEEPVKSGELEKCTSPTPSNAPQEPATPSETAPVTPSAVAMPIVTPTTTTRTGRVVKPKKWGDE